MEICAERFEIGLSSRWIYSVISSKCYASPYVYHLVEKPDHFQHPKGSRSKANRPMIETVQVESS